MSVSDTELKARYEELTDAALLELWNQGTLTDVAKMVLQAEIRERGIPIPASAEAEPADEIAELDEIEFNGKWITLAQYSTGPQAHILRTRLEADNIPAVVADEHQVTANWLWSNALGGVKVRVPEPYQERALEVLKKYESGDYALDEEEH